MTKQDFWSEKYWENATEQSKMSEEALNDLKNRYEELFPEPEAKRVRFG